MSEKIQKKRKELLRRKYPICPVCGKVLVPDEFVLQLRSKSIIFGIVCSKRCAEITKNLRSFSQTPFNKLRDWDGAR